MVYTLMKDEMAKEGGIHALQLRTRTPEEEKKQKAREEVEKSGVVSVQGGEVAKE